MTLGQTLIKTNCDKNEENIADKYFAYSDVASPNQIGIEPPGEDPLKGHKFHKHCFQAWLNRARNLAFQEDDDL